MKSWICKRTIRIKKTSNEEDTDEYLVWSNTSDLKPNLGSIHSLNTTNNIPAMAKIKVVLWLLTIQCSIWIQSYNPDTKVVLNVKRKLFHAHHYSLNIKRNRIVKLLFAF